MYQIIGLSIAVSKGALLTRLGRTPKFIVANRGLKKRKHSHVVWC